MEFRKLALKTGVTLNVALAGDRNDPALILLHGFPESHRTWRGLVPLLDRDFFLVMPDQRGFGASDRPQEVDSYRTDTVIDDVFALADTLGLTEFALVGHDFGGAIAWPAALRQDARITRLVIINAPHPVIFQKSLIENADQRAASQYIRMFRTPGAETIFAAMGLEGLFERAIGSQVEQGRILQAEKQQYIDEWSQPGALTGMLNWYRASKVLVPPTSATVPIPEWVLGAFPKVTIPTLVIWGMRDTALLPVQLEGLERLVEDLEVARLPGVGHFAPWDAPEAVADALLAFLRRHD